MGHDVFHRGGEDCIPSNGEDPLPKNIDVLPQEFQRHKKDRFLKREEK